MELVFADTVRYDVEAPLADRQERPSRAVQLARANKRGEKWPNSEAE